MSANSSSSPNPCSSSNADNLIKELSDAIISKTSILPILRSVPVVKWTEQYSQHIMANILVCAHQHLNKNAVKEVIDYYTRVRHDPLPPTMWTQTANLPVEVGLWCRQLLQYSTKDYWKMLLNISDCKLAVAVVKHFHTHMPLKHHRDWQQLIGLMEPNPALADPGEEPLPHHNQELRVWLTRNQPLEKYPKELPTVTEYADNVKRFFGEGKGKVMPQLSGIDHGPQSTDEVIHTLITTYAGSRYILRCKMAAVVFPDQVKKWPNYNDTPVHQRFGPVNALTNKTASLDDNDHCTAYGGCRMLTCQEFEQHDDGDTEVDWFTGKCVHCSKEIKHREDAARQPLLHGGWRGCFCTWLCVIDYIESVGYCERDQDVLIDLAERFSVQLSCTPIV